jgi:uncharacterized protein (DUF2252 family)
MNIVKATKKFEDWLRLQIRLVEPDLRFKHEQMAAALFPFFRATFYRWVQVWPEQCSELDCVPEILSVGDLHVENFGTWRDLEGRLIWGVNDFDEAAIYPYTMDLVRLATSALLAAQEKRLTMRPKDAVAAILAGYERGMEEGGIPFCFRGTPRVAARYCRKQASRSGAVLGKNRPPAYDSRTDSKERARGA